MRRPLRIALAAGLAGALACAAPEPHVGGNLLLLIADDLGIDHLASYGLVADAPATPNLDALAARGMTFRNAYAPPACSPSRAAMLTGRYPFRSGIGTRLEAHGDDWELPLEEVTLPEALALAPTPYANAAIGKWHLSTLSSPHAREHPLASGFDAHLGTLANLAVRGSSGARGDYFRWESLRNGVVGEGRGYATTASVDDALERMHALPVPWFLWVAFHAPHRPLHRPPTSLTSHATATPLARYRASIEALDSEIGRLLAATPADTTVVFVSDNGTPGDFARPPFDVGHAKGTLYEAGMRVPLIVAGPAVAVPGSRSDALVHVADLFPTFLEIAGVDPGALEGAEGLPLALDGRSLLPLLRDPAAPGVREFVFQGRSKENGPGPRAREEWMVRDATHKLTRVCEGARCDDTLARLEGVIEGAPLSEPLAPADAAELVRLRAALDGLLAGR